MEKRWSSTLPATSAMAKLESLTGSEETDFSLGF
jgi:hypothetical protein